MSDDGRLSACRTDAGESEDGTMDETSETPAPAETGRGHGPTELESNVPDDTSALPATRRAIPRRLRFEILRRDGHACRYCGAMAPEVKLTVDHVVPVALGGGDEPSNLATACEDCNNGKASTSPDSALVEDVAADALKWAKAVDAAVTSRLTEREVLDGITSRFEDEWNDWTFEYDVRVPPAPFPATGDPVVDGWHHLNWPLRTCASPVGLLDGVLKIQVDKGSLTDVRRALKTKRTMTELDRYLGRVESVEVVPGWDPIEIPYPNHSTTVTEQARAELPSGWRDSVERFISLGLPEPEVMRYITVTMERRGIKLVDRWRFFCGCCWRALTDIQEDARRVIESDGD